MTQGSPATPVSRSIVVETLGSTNQDCLDRARQGECGPLWVRALVQTEGRGRIGRPWSSPLGNLYTSLLLVDPAPSHAVPQIGFVAGVALARAVRRIPGVGGAVALKWPNDLVHQGAKLAGILVEGFQKSDGAFACVVGFGVNCLSHPTGLAYAATNLRDVTGAAHSAEALSQDLAREWDDALALWDRGTNFASIRALWLGLALSRGAALSVKRGGSLIEGQFDTIDQMGRLRLMTPSGVVTVEAADVFAMRPDRVAAI